MRVRQIHSPIVAFHQERPSSTWHQSLWRQKDEQRDEKNQCDTKNGYAQDEWRACWFIYIFSLFWYQFGRAYNKSIVKQARARVVYFSSGAGVHPLICLEEH